jgi:16S rRNA (guanine527-N7)-methyltransferase
MSAALRDSLEQGVRALDLELNEAQVSQLLDYQALLQKWNRVYNLTAVRDPAEMLTHHLLDSLAAVPALERQLSAQSRGASTRLLDVGSGGGLPGAVFAICLPQLAVQCVDTVAKKAAFLQQVAVTLRLQNLQGIHARVEALAGPFDVVCSRAFASLKDFTAWSREALADGGVWMAMKGRRPDEEMAELSSEVEVFHVEHLQVPGLNAERCIVWMRPQSASLA